MRAFIATVQRLADFLYYWIKQVYDLLGSGFLLLKDLFSMLRDKALWFVAAVIVILGLIADAFLAIPALLGELATEIVNIKLLVDGIDVGSATFQFHEAYRLGNYVLPLHEAITFLVLFISMKSIVTLMRIAVKIYELIPLKST